MYYSNIVILCLPHLPLTGSIYVTICNFFYPVLRACASAVVLDKSFNAIVYKNDISLFASKSQVNKYGVYLRYTVLVELISIFPFLLQVFIEGCSKNRVSLLV